MTPEELNHLLQNAATRQDCVAAVARFFATHDLVYGHGTTTAQDEAWWLVWQLSGQPAELGALPMDPALIPGMLEVAGRRVAERMPLAYLTGSAFFAGLEFEVDSSVLVPRSPLAELIERRFAPWYRPRPGDRLLEIGTGSGCIAIASALALPEVLVDATDIDAAGLELARRNVQRHGVGSRVRLLQADLFPDEEIRYRVIISNPPYVPTREVRSLPAEYGHEPAAALDGGEDGLDVVRRILDGAAERLTSDGVLIVEVGLTWEALAQAYPRVPWTWIEFEFGGEGVFVLTAEELKHGWR